MKRIPLGWFIRMSCNQFVPSFYEKNFKKMTYKETIINKIVEKDIENLYLCKHPSGFQYFDPMIFFENLNQDQQRTLLNKLKTDNFKKTGTQFYKVVAEIMGPSGLRNFTKKLLQSMKFPNNADEYLCYLFKWVTPSKSIGNVGSEKVYFIDIKAVPEEILSRIDHKQPLTHNDMLKLGALVMYENPIISSNPSSFYSPYGSSPYSPRSYRNMQNPFSSPFVPPLPPNKPRFRRSPSFVPPLPPNNPPNNPRRSPQFEEYLNSMDYPHNKNFRSLRKQYSRFKNERDYSNIPEVEFGRRRKKSKKFKKL